MDEAEAREVRDQIKDLPGHEYQGTSYEDGEITVMVVGPSGYVQEFAQRDDWDKYMGHLRMHEEDFGKGGE